MKPTSGKYIKLHRIFSNVGLAFTAMVFVLLFAIMVIWGAKNLRTWLETKLRQQFFANLKTTETIQQTQSPASNTPPTVKFGEKPITQEEVSPKPPVIVPKNIEENLTLSSFSDLFSGVGWIDQSGTTMYQDRSSTAFLFPPVITSQKIATPPGRFIERGPNGEDVRCAGSKCFSQREFELLFQGNPLALPAEIKGKQLVNISVGNLDTLLLLGVVVKRDDGKYEGWGFYFDPVRNSPPIGPSGAPSAGAISNGVDGKSWSKVFGGDGNPFVSQYIGTLGFGGSDNDWLAIYGAYEGIAYRIRDGREPEDLSYFFRPRIMADGFQPVILLAHPKSDEGWRASSATWYVFSLTPGNPKLIKLFQNKTEKIQGVIDLTRLLESLQNTTKASFIVSSVKSGEIILHAKTERGGNIEWWEVKDNGFDKSEIRTITSANINNYPAELRTASIKEVDLSASGASFEFSLSSDGKVWEPAVLRQDVIFNGQNRQRLLWRVKFTPDNDPETTPFFDRLQLSYQVKFL